MITTGNLGSIVATLLSDDTILLGASSAATLANATTANIGTSSLGALHLTGRATTNFTNTQLIVHTLNSASLGVVDTTTATPAPDGIALLVTRSITGTENGSRFRFNTSNKISDLFSTFAIELITA